MSEYDIDVKVVQGAQGSAGARPPAEVDRVSAARRAAPRPLAARLVAVGLNPTIDRTIHLPALTAGSVLRATHVVASAGGKALNVCRAARALGASALHIGPAPGELGRAMLERIADEGIDVQAVPADGEIRVSSIYLETASDPPGRATVVNEPGPPLDADGFARVVDALVTTLDQGAVAAEPGWVAISGSAPPGTSARAHEELIAGVHTAGGRVAVDVGGERLAAAAAAGADLVSPNLAEAEHALGISARYSDVVDDATSRDDVAARSRAAASALVAGGAGMALVSAGRHGVAVVAAGVDAFVPAPHVEVANPVGAGDSLLGATLVALACGAPLLAGVEAGVAYAAASVAHPVAGYAEPAAAAAIADQILAPATIATGQRRGTR